LIPFSNSFSSCGNDDQRIFDVFIDFSGFGIFFFDLFSLSLENLIKVFQCLADKKILPI
jgi:hypothetical protein